MLIVPPGTKFTCVLSRALEIPTPPRGFCYWTTHCAELGRTCASARRELSGEERMWLNTSTGPQLSRKSLLPEATEDEQGFDSKLFLQQNTKHRERRSQPTAVYYELCSSQNLGHGILLSWVSYPGRWAALGICDSHRSSLTFNPVIRPVSCRAILISIKKPGSPNLQGSCLHFLQDLDSLLRSPTFWQGIYLKRTDTPWTIASLISWPWIWTQKLPRDGCRSHPPKKTRIRLLFSHHFVGFTQCRAYQNKHQNNTS